jgi:hypothetical protein
MGHDRERSTGEGANSGLRLIALFKLTKAILLLAAGLGALKLPGDRLRHRRG